MGKKKDKFINSSKAVVIKLGSRDIQDPNRQQELDNKPIYEIISYPDEQRLSEQEKAKRDRILGVFDDVDQGIYNPEESKENQFQGGEAGLEEAMKMAEGKSGLWIHTLQKMKQQQMRSKLLESGEYDDVEIEEGEEMEDIDEDEEYEEFEDVDESEFNNDKKKQYMSLDQFNKQAEKKLEDKYEYNEIDYTKIKLSNTIKMKRLNQHGLPADDGYDYEQHIFNNVRPEGDLIATMNVNERAPICKPDIDYEVGEMTEEQKEVFASLQNDAKYEDLDDDFVAMAQEGEECIIEENADQLQCKLPIRKDSDKIAEEEERELARAAQLKKEELKFAQNTKKVEINKDDDILEDEEFDEEEFKKAMDMYDECDQEEELNQNEQIGQSELNDILDSHLTDMKQREVSQVQFDETKNKSHQHADLLGVLDKIKLKEEEENFIKTGEKGKEFNPETLYQYNYKRRMREEREIKIIDRGAVKQEQIDQYGDQVLQKTHVAPLTNEEDIALQTYINKDAETEAKEEEALNKHFEKLVEPRQLNETIATKSFSMSTVHEHLNVVDESRKRKNNKLEQSQIEENSEEEEEDDKIRDVSSIFAKRSKEESEEERKLRKKLVKEFNKQRKDAKRQFKNDFSKLSNAQKNKLQKQTQTDSNVRGATVTKM